MNNKQKENNMIINFKKISISERICWAVALAWNIICGVIAYNNLNDVDEMLASCEQYAAQISQNVEK